MRRPERLYLCIVSLSFSPVYNIEGTHVVIFSQAVYGVLSGLEGLDAFQDLMTNTSMKPWYDRVKTAVQTRAGAHTV